MSRVFTSSSLNFLEATGNIAVSTPYMTLAAFVKDDNTGGYQRTFASLGSAGSGGSYRRWINTRQTAGVAEANVEGGPSLYGGSNAVPNNTWTLVVLRAIASVDGTLWSLWAGNTKKTETLSGVNGIVSGSSNVVIGQTPSGSNTFKGKVAHTFVFTRGLTDAEINSIASGSSPSSLDPTGRYAYYPMDGASLVNEWEADSGVGNLIVNGTVANDDADNPTVDAVVLDPAVTTTDTIAPGAIVTVTCSNFTTYPTSVSLLDSSDVERLSLTLTQVAGDEHTFTIPAAPSADASVQLMKDGPITLKFIGGEG